MRRISWGPAGLAALLALSSCDVPPEELPLGAGSALSASDAALAAHLYSGAPRTPAGFFTDPAPASFLQVTTYHLKSQQLLPSAASSYELCSDDWSQALAWSEQVAAQAPVYLDLVGNDTTERYFEFDRVPRGAPERYVRMRVFRCAYLDRSAVDLVQASAAAGTLNRRPLDAAALRELSEYLWLFTSYNNVGHAVVASEPLAGSSPGHVITIASLEYAANGATCDRVTLRTWAHAADSASGELRLVTTPVRSFSVRRDAGIVGGC